MIEIIIKTISDFFTGDPDEKLNKYIKNELLDKKSDESIASKKNI